MDADILIFGHESSLPYLLSQFFAIVATIFSLFSVQQRKKVKILDYTVAAAIFGVVHYVFLSAWSGALSKAVSATRSAIADYGVRRHKDYKLLPFAFIFAYIILGIPTFNSPFSLLPIVAPSIYTLALYFGNVSQIRYAAALSSMLWLVYDVYVVSVIGVVTEFIFMANNLVAIYRYGEEGHRRKRRQVYKKTSSQPSKTHPRNKQANSRKKSASRPNGRRTPSYNHQKRKSHD